MSYDFDQKIDRKHTGSLKYDFAVQRGKPEHILPLWVADMDFQAPKEVIQALVNRSQHGIFGYSESEDNYFKALYQWYHNNFNWSVKQEWLIKTPGIVFALACAVRAFTQKGDGVLIQQPVYYPFHEVVTDNERVLVNSPLELSDGRYQINFNDFEQKIIKHKVKLFLLCSPHNPVGRVWTERELQQLGEICLRHNVLVVSDEIHSDFVWDGHKHHIFSQAVPQLEQHCIICTAPSKTFNLAGLQVSNIWIPNETIRQNFQMEITKTGYSQLNSMGLVACEAAYLYGSTWLKEIKIYIKRNIDYIKQYLKHNHPSVMMIEPEGTYLVWLDFSCLKLSDYDLDQFMIEKANLWLDSGTMFGSEGSQFQRINAACPMETLKQAMKQLTQALSTE